MKLGIALLAGLLFGLGLSLGGMTSPAVVLGFLDIAGVWNPRLLFVMLGAVLTTAIGYRWVWSGPRPWFDDAFHVPDATRFDKRLVIGALLFGMGWGIAGYCPGPALASLSGGYASVLVLVGSMALGWWLGARVPAQKNR